MSQCQSGLSPTLAAAPAHTQFFGKFNRISMHPAYNIASCVCSRWSSDDELVMNLSGIWEVYGKFPKGAFWLDLFTLLPVDYILLGQMNSK